MTERADVRGRLVLDDRVVVGRLAIEDGWIAAVDLEPGVDPTAPELPYISPGFVELLAIVAELPDGRERARSLRRREGPDGRGSRAPDPHASARSRLPTGARA